jgi:site-specific DNA-cytosine methylase
VFIVGHLGGIGERKVFPIGENGEFSDKEQQQPIFREIQTRKQKDSSNANRKDAQNGKNGQLHYIGGIEGKRKKWLEDGKDNSRNFSQGQRVYSDKGISSTLAGNAGGLGGKTGLYQIDMKIRRLTPTECERLQGFPDGWTEGISDTQRYKCLGNAVTTNVIEAIGKKLIWLTINKKEL